MKYIYTCQPAASKLAASEFKKEDDSYHFIDWLDSGVGLFESEKTIYEMNDLIKTTPIIFTRHIFEVDAEFDCTDAVDDTVQLIVSYALSMLKKDLSYSLQLRTLDNETMKAYRNELREKISDAINQQGYTQDMKYAQQVLSVFVTKKKAYASCAPSTVNLSKWNGGMMHCAKEGMISRAEFKLLEAIELFDIDMTKFHSAADLGAAPGGWTNVLLDYNLDVTAIDPAKMNPDLLKHPKLKHYKEMTQTFLMRGIDKKYDIIVNDMKMDVVQSASITNEFEPLLSEDGVIIMTFKLPNNYNYLMVKKGLEELSKCYRYITARQLFHNRSEITVVFGKKHEVEQK